MCIFSGHVDSVSKTNIFGRLCEENHQALVYSMEFSSDKDVAMILPIPVDKNSKNPVFFKDLSDYPTFFKDMEKPFAFVAKGRDYSTEITRSIGTNTLEVHK